MDARDGERTGPRWLPWGLVALAWLAGALFWSLAAIAGQRIAIGEALVVGAVQMGAAGVLGLGVWRLTGAVPLRQHPGRFAASHAAAIALFAVLYTAAPCVALADGKPIRDAVVALLASPVTGWNLLIGCIIYLAVAGLSYARRTDLALRDSERARAEARLTARDAQLAALSARLQPHFLFNALHTVGALVHEDADRADRALDQLGHLLRYALREPSDDVTLGEEWSFTRDYLAFESLRLGERLRLACEVDDAVLGTRVPPFILQPLVENAVRHAAASAEGGSLTVRVSRHERAVRIVVRNSVADGAATPGMAGSGLASLRERLVLRYGPAAAGVESANGDGFTVAVTVPAGAGGAG